MASMWRRAMLYLGLGPDDEYDDYEPMEEPAVGPARPSVPSPSRYPATPAPVRELEREPEMSPSRSVRTIGTQPVRPQPVGDGGDPSARPRTAVVRPLQPVQSAKPYVV